MPKIVTRGVSRREMLCQCGLGLGGLGLSALLAQLGCLNRADASESTNPLAPRDPHFAPRAKRVIHIFPAGGPSQVDTFDPKPALKKHHGIPFSDELLAGTPETATAMGRLSGRLQQSPFEFQKHGDAGIDISELFPQLAKQADHLCVVRSMTAKSSSHERAQLLMTNGEATLARPSLGSWVLYGLGAENQNLPAFVALSVDGTVRSGAKNLGSAFLPVWTEGTGISTKEVVVERILENIRSSSTSLSEQGRQIELLAQLHLKNAHRLGQDSVLDDRIRTFETAFRMQVEASDAFDLSREPRNMHDLYGETEQGRQLLLARRLLERGVRFVQVWHNGWDTHDENDKRHRDLCHAADQPLAALLQDLHARDMLRDTLVLWAGEFGRTPTSDNNDVASKKGIGRDHNAGGFTIWMAGGGVKPGMVYGSTDDFGAIAVEGAMDVHDLHATILHLLGFDHTQLTYRYAGRDFRLTDVHGRVNHDLLA